jgi:hypothetical protein
VPHFICCYAERHNACVTMLNVVMLNVVMLNVLMLNVVMLNVVMLSVFMLSVFMLSVFMLSVFMLSVIMLSVFMLSAFVLSVVAPFITVYFAYLSQTLMFKKMIIRCQNLDFMIANKSQQHPCIIKSLNLGSEFD